MAKVEIGYNMASAFHVGDNAYTVEVLIGAGNCAYHAGPEGFPYFTEEQAIALAHEVSMGSFIELADWVDGYGKPLQASQVAPRPKFSL